MFWVISTALVLHGVTIAARGQQKNPWVRFSRICASAKNQLSFEMSWAEISFAFVLQKRFYFGFQRNESLLCSLLYCGANLINFDYILSKKKSGNAAFNLVDY
jgi:hypothetical protein